MRSARSLRVALVAATRRDFPGNVNDIVGGIESGLPGAEVRFLNIAQGGVGSTLRDGLRGADVVVVHNTAAYRALDLESILRAAAKTTNSPKTLVMKQDEHVEPYAFDRLFAQFGVGAVLTCLRSEDASRVYPQSNRDGVTFRRMTTAYLPAYLVDAPVAPLPEEFRVTYRGKPQPVQLGRLGQQKTMLSVWASDSMGAARRSWILDASSSLEERVYGDAWLDLLGRSTAVLGSESGTNVFDLDGSLRRRTREFMRNWGQFGWEDSDLALSFSKKVLVDYEGNVNYGTIAPRHLEAAVLGRPQILTPGRYENLFVDGQSAFFVDDSCSNLSTVLEQVSDPGERARVAAASREVVLSTKELRLGSFLDELSGLVTELAEGVGGAVVLDARSKANHLQNGKTRMAFVPQSDSEAAEQRLQSWVRGSEELDLDRQIWDINNLEGRSIDWKSKGDISVGREITGNSASGRLSTLSFSCRTKSSREVVAQWLVRNSGAAAAPLVAAILQLSHVDSKGATRDWPQDLVRRIATMIAAATQQDLHFIMAQGVANAFAATVAFGPGHKIICELLEPELSPPGSVSRGVALESELWSKVRVFSLSKASHVVTTCDAMAGLLKQEQIPALIVSSLKPRVDESDFANPHHEPVRFVCVFGKGRDQEIPKLLSEWRVPPTRAELHLLLSAEQRRRYQRDVDSKAGIFCKPLSEKSRGEPSLGVFDVGVVTFDPTYPRNYSLPVELAEYLESGLVVLANDVESTTRIVRQGGVGEVFCWRDSDSLSEAADRLADREALERHRQAAATSYPFREFLGLTVQDFLHNMLDSEPIDRLSVREGPEVSEIHKPREASRALEFRATRSEAAELLTLVKSEDLAASDISVLGRLVNFVGRARLQRFYSRTQENKILARSFHRMGKRFL